MIKNGGKKTNAKHVLQFVETHGGIEYAAKRGREFAAMAKTNISSFSDSVSKQSLLSFADFVVDREK